VRILVVHPGPSFSVADVHHGLVKGLRQCGAEVGTVNLDARLALYAEAMIRKGREIKYAFDNAEATAMANRSITFELYTFWPDIVIFTSAIFITPDVWAILGRRPPHTVAWFTESPYEDDRQMIVARHADTAIINDPTNLNLFRRQNHRTFHLPQSYDPDIHSPGSAVDRYRCDFGWVGTAFGSRYNFFRQVDWTGIDAKFGGHWTGIDGRTWLARRLVHPKTECMDNVDAVDLYRSAKMSANLYRREATHPDLAHGWAVGPREVELAACGTFMLRDSRPEGDELFPKAPIFESPAEFGDMIRWWSAHDSQREEVARVNREAIADRTFKNTAARLLELIDGAPKRTH
jgi:spore maturation protein CgeB